MGSEQTGSPLACPRQSARSLGTIGDPLGRRVRPAYHGVLALREGRDGLVRLRREVLRAHLSPEASKRFGIGTCTLAELQNCGECAFLAEVLRCSSRHPKMSYTLLQAETSQTREGYLSLADSSPASSATAAHGGLLRLRRRALPARVAAPTKPLQHNYA